MVSITRRVFTLVACVLAVYACTLLYLSQTFNDYHPPHTDFVETDEVIIILGYKLYDDGMPTRILRDRVARAVELYKQLQQHGHHPLVIVSGKGKTEVEYTEAQAMKELAAWMGVRSGDILIDHDSTNTVQNALFSSALIQNKGISEAFIVTSDYHMLRTQYIFQTVFPRNLPRWQMIEREINDDLKVRKGLGSVKGMVVVDYGSNYGYFSLQISQKFPSGTVISLEGEAWKEYDGAADFHLKKMEELSVKNNYLCRTLVAPTMFGELHQAGQVYDYQLSLSVFHWFVPMNTREVFEESLANHLLNSRTTFIELPEAMNYTGKEGQHMWQRISVWYVGRNEEQVIQGVADKYNFEVAIKTLGAILHSTGTVRKLIRVDVVANRRTWDLKTMLKIYKCSQVSGGKE